MDPGGFYEGLLKRFHDVCLPNSTEVICEGYKPSSPPPMGEKLGMSFQHDIISYKVSTPKQFENS